MPPPATSDHRWTVSSPWPAPSGASRSQPQSTRYPSPPRPSVPSRISDPRFSCLLGYASERFSLASDVSRPADGACLENPELAFKKTPPLDPPPCSHHIDATDHFRAVELCLSREDR